MRVAAVIPARLGSRRFPRKVLAKDTGKYLVQHVYERVVACEFLETVVIATDSEEVLRAAAEFGADVRMTSATHVSGTDRVAEVARDLDVDIVVNVQGDEPCIESDDLQALVALFEENAAADPDAGVGEVVMTTLATARDDREGFLDPNIVKAIVGSQGDALYFSRAPAPYAESDNPAPEWLQHVGLYAYRRGFLLRLATLPPTALEKRERLEQLRVLEHGYRIRVGLTAHSHLGIDTEEEYRRFVELYRRALVP